MAKKKANRYFYVKGIDTTITVEYGKSKRDVMDWLDEMIENMQYDFYVPSGDTFLILYDDGTEDYINEDYDGHKIKRQHIVSIVYSNAESYLVFGNIEMNEYGVVYPAFEEKIDTTNIKEIDKERYFKIK